MTAKRRTYSKREKVRTLNTVFLTDRQVEEMTGRSRGTLQNDRYKGQGIPYYRVTPKAIRYKLSDVMDYIEKRRVDPEAA